MSVETDPTATKPSSAWAWGALVLALAWTVVIRIPLVLNAPAHMDSDLAVDGLTLMEAVQGSFRWHYPGTPYMGVGPAFLSLPQALAWGVTPATLVSGGTVAAMLLIIACFLLARETYGVRVACWSLVPLTFASSGAVWLSGRITGGHLLAAAGHAGAFAILARCLARPSRKGWLALGCWCGLGYYFDSMFAVSLFGVGVAAAWSFLASTGRALDLAGTRRGIACVSVFLVGFLMGAWPRPVGVRLDPYDAYSEQFAVSTDPHLVLLHGSLFGLECVPRLIAGHLIPSLATEPDPATMTPGGASRKAAAVGPVAFGATMLSLGLFVASLVVLIREPLSKPGSIEGAAVAGLLASAGAVTAGFLLNRNIFNSDNYRYLIFGLVPWSLGFGLFMQGISSRGRRGCVAATLLAAGFAVLMTVDLRQWYAEFGWIDDRGAPRRAAPEDPVLAWLDARPDVRWIEGGYWDVYRLAFLTQGRVRGVPFSIYPNRFPEWNPPAREATAVVARSTREGAYFREQAIQNGRKVVARARGVVILQ